MVEPSHDVVPTEPFEIVLEPRPGALGAEPLVAAGRVVRVESGGQTRGRLLAIAFEQPLSEDNLARNVQLPGSGRPAEEPA